MENIGQLFKQISNHLVKDVNNNLKEYNLTIAQLQVLNVLNDEETTMCQRDIANILKIKHTSLIDILKVLERKDLIIKWKNEENAKFMNVELTKKAKCILAQLSIGKDKTQQMMAVTLGFSSVQEMLEKFKNVLIKLEEGDNQ